MSAAPAYLDHAATTPVRPEVVEAMLPYLGATFGNPSSSHAFGRAARVGLEQARREVAEAIGAEPGEVYFTSGGTEADNLAVLGRALAARAAGAPFGVAVAATEHKAVLAAAHAVVQLGGREQLLPVDAEGTLDRATFTTVLGTRPAVVSVMWVNNETGVVQPVTELAAAAAAAGVPFHTDMVQAFGKLPVTLAGTPVALASISGHKLGAPKGIGALVVRRGTTIAPLVTGGSQQRGLRPGTENLAGAVALGRAAILARAEAAGEHARLTGLRSRLLAGLRDAVPDLVVVAEGAVTAPHVLAVLVPGTESTVLLMHLDRLGVAASGGSACSSGATEPSHVLAAMGLPPALARGLVRLSLGHGSTEADVAATIAAFPEAVSRARQLTGALSHG